MSAAARFRTVPVFVPHLGCPHACVFCDQHTISGAASFDPGDVPRQIEETLATIPPDAHTEIAFFGGSFTAIDRGLMTSLLETASGYVRRGKATAIRLSTRPDCVDDGILELLRRFPVKTIELGLQSLDDAVLTASGRGHTAACGRDACRRVREAGFSVVGQMMTGLPGASRESDRGTAAEIAALCDAARIYPTVVIRGTALEKMAARGLYAPLTVDEAVRRSADALECFLDKDIPVIRIGLCESDGLRGGVVAGGYHPAVGELVMSEVWLRRLRRELQTLPCAGKRLTIFCAGSAVSRVVGMRGGNRTALQEEFHVRKISVTASDGLTDYQYRIEISDS